MGNRYLYFHTLLISMLTILFLYTRINVLLVFLFSYTLYYVVTYKSKSIALLLVLLFSFMVNYNQKVSLDDNWETHTGIVDNVYSSSITVIDEGERYYLYGDIEKGLVKGDEVTYTTNYYNDFSKGSFDIFYRSTKSIGAGKAYDFEVTKENDDLRSGLHDEIYNDETFYSDITLLMLYGEPKGYGVSLDNKINRMGISHLFVVSGFHISLFFIILEKLGSSFINNRNLVLGLSFCISTGFLFLIYFPPTGIRALVTTLFVRIGNFDRVEGLSITGLIFFVLNPWLMLSSSMILSFSITLAIYVYRPRQSSIVDMITLSMFAFYISLPTVSTWEEQHNLFSPLLSMVMTPIVSFVYIVALVSLPFQNIWVLLNPLFELFYLLISIFSQINLTFTANLLSPFNQILLTGMSLYYIHIMRYHKWVIFNTFFSMSLIIFLI